MIKKILLVATFLTLPAFALAQGVGDDAPIGGSATCVSLTSDMGYRSTDSLTGGQVSLLQDYLQEEGYLNSEPTGFFGRLTTAAAKSFQTANGIRPTGYVGPITRSKIQSLTCGSSSTISTNNSQNVSSNDRQVVYSNSSKVSFGIPTSVNVNSKISFSWTINQPYVPKAKDWIGIVPKGHIWRAGDGARFKWVYTGGKNVGSGEIDAPSSPGLYDIVYFEDDLLVEIARSGPINVVGNNVTQTNIISQTATSTSSSSVLPELNLEIVGNVTVNSPFTVRWTSSNTRKCFSPNGSISVGGSSTNLSTSGSIERTYTLGANANYQLTCEGAGGFVNRAVSITATQSSQSSQNTQSTNTSSDTSAPSTPTALSKISVTSNSASIAWGNSTDNVGVSGYRIYRDGILVGTSASASYQDLGLSPQSAYSYSVAAYDYAGNVSSRSSPLSITTLQANTSTTNSSTNQNTTTASSTTTQTQTVITNYSVSGNKTSLSKDQDITVTWQMPSSISPTSLDYVALLPTTSNIWGGNGGYVATGGLRQGSANLRATSGGSFYLAFFRNVTTSGSNPAYVDRNSTITVSSFSSSAVQDNTPPSVPIGLTSSSVTSSAINLVWNASTDNVGVSMYQIYRRGSPLKTSVTTSLVDDAVQPSTMYDYTVRAIDIAGNMSNHSQTLNVTTPALAQVSTSLGAGATPINLKLETVATETSAKLVWEAGPSSSSVVGFKVFRNNVEVGIVTSTIGDNKYRFEATGLSAGQGYVFDVYAYSSNGNLSPKATLDVTAADNTPPSQPTGLTATNITASSFTLNWTPSTDNQAVYGYFVNENGVRVGTVSFTTYPVFNVLTTFTVSGLAQGVTNSYQIIAYDGGGNQSQASAPLQVTTTLPQASSLTPVDSFNYGAQGSQLNISGGNVTSTNNPTNCVPTFNTGCGYLGGYYQFAPSASYVDVNWNVSSLGITPRASDVIAVIKYVTGSNDPIIVEKEIGSASASGSISLQLPTYASGSYNGNVYYGAYYLAYVQRSATTANRYIDAKWVGIRP